MTEGINLDLYLTTSSYLREREGGPSYKNDLNMGRLTTGRGGETKGLRLFRGHIKIQILWSKKVLLLPSKNHGMPTIAREIILKS